MGCLCYRDHRNGSMLRDWLVKEFIGNNKTGLGNPNVDGACMILCGCGGRRPQGRGGHPRATLCHAT